MEGTVLVPVNVTVVLGISSDLAQPLAIITKLLHSIYKAASLLITLGSLIYLFFSHNYR